MKLNLSKQNIPQCRSSCALLSTSKFNSYVCFIIHNTKITFLMKNEIDIMFGSLLVTIYEN